MANLVPFPVSGSSSSSALAHADSPTPVATGRPEMPIPRVYRIINPRHPAVKAYHPPLTLLGRYVDTHA